jgi:phage protein D
MLGNSYEDLYEKYDKFMYPMLTVIIGDKDFSENKNDLVLSSMMVDLSCGVEASVATFSIYNVYNISESQYYFSKFKSYVQLGNAVTISMGYGAEREEIFVGFIAQVRFVRNASDIHHVEVTAMDAKGLMMSNSYARQMTASNYGDAITEIFRKQIYQKMNAEGIYRSLNVTDTPDKSDSSDDKETAYSIEMVSESDYEFIVKAAKRFNYEFFIDTGNIYFRKAKQTKEECLMELGMEKGIVDYDITYDMTGLVKTVEVRGMDTAKAQMVSATKNVSNKISTGNKAKSLISQSSKVVIDANAISKSQAQCRADSLMEEISYRFGSLECTCVGIPELKPGHFIRLTNFESPCDNTFYITHAKHIMTDEGGYYTRLTAQAAALEG